MASDVANRLDWVSGTIDFTFIALHGLLNVPTELAEANINPCLADTCIGCVLDGCEEIVVHRIEGHGEGAVDDPTIHMDADVDLHDIILLEYLLAACIWAVMSSNLVEVQAGWETHAGNNRIAFGQAVVSDKTTHTVLDPIGNFHEGLARLDGFLRPLTDLAMRLGRLTVIGEEIAVDVIKMALLFVGGTIAVVTLVVDLFALGVVVAGKQLRDEDGWRVGLYRGSFLLGLLLLVLLLLRTSSRSGGSGFWSMLVGIVVGFSARGFCSIALGGSSGAGGAVDPVRLLDYTSFRQLVLLMEAS